MGLALRLYRGLAALVPLAAPALLRRRIARGKEDPDRWRERLGQAGSPRPDGPLIWLNGVGLGEVLALRALIAPLSESLPDAHFLVTSTARTAAAAFARSAPPRTVHQYIPLDAPSYLRRFFDHWRPDLLVWTDQELWPGAIHEAQRRGIPQTWINARMDAASLRRWGRLPGLLPDLLQPMRLIRTQTLALAEAVQAAGLAQARQGPGLKPAAPPLAADPAELATLRAAIGGRRVWAVCPSHPPDEALALAAHRDMRDALLIVVPRDIGRGAAVAEAARAAGFDVARRSAGQGPASAQVYVADTIGETGLWYRLAPTVLIGGSFGETEGHSPWEALALGAAVLHGPRTGNFAIDYAQADAAGAARQITAETAFSDIAAEPGNAGAIGQQLCAAARGDVAALARELAALVRR